MSQDTPAATDYAWLIPKWRPLRALYHATENNPAGYALTWPLWFGRYHWLYRRVFASQYDQAFRALCLNSIAEHAAGVTGETAESGPLNSAAHEARCRVPRWRCWLIQRRVVRELDYWNRMDGVA